MDKKQAARLALEKMDGPAKAAKQLTHAMREAVSVDVTKKWPERGVGYRYAPYVALLSGVSLQALQGMEDEH